jgi:hypothetical protein
MLAMAGRSAGNEGIFVMILNIPRNMCQGDIPLPYPPPPEAVSQFNTTVIPGETRNPGKLRKIK